MPYKVKTHEENRSLICCVCWRKCDKNSRSVTKAIEDLVKKFVFESYSSLNESYPSSICGSCRVCLTEMEKVTLFEIYQCQIIFIYLLEP